MDDRYIRQVALHEIGESGQLLLKEAKVLVVGAGGLGCPVLTYLACAGVGHMTIVDDDLISSSNLNRQFLYNPSDIGQVKSVVAKEVLNRQNPEIDVIAIYDRLTEANVEELLHDIHIVVDCVDNIATRLILNKACLKKDIPLIEGGVEGFYGFLTLVKRETACLECMGFYEGSPKVAAPVIGVTAGIIGLFEANECIRIILGYESDLGGKYLQYDGHKQSIQKVNVKISPDCHCHQSLHESINRSMNNKEESR